MRVENAHFCLITCVFTLLIFAFPPINQLTHIEEVTVRPMPPKLRGDAAPATSRRNGRYVATQRRLHRDAVGKAKHAI